MRNGYCVGPGLNERCRAIQDRLRPWEVAHLWAELPCHELPRHHTIVESVARWFQKSLARQRLKYIADPPACDAWRPPAVTLQLGGGDCDDLAILAAAMLTERGVTCHVTIGRMCSHTNCAGHAWVEGWDDKGFFHLEATTGTITRGRPTGYHAIQYAAGSWCVAA